MDRVAVFFAAFSPAIFVFSYVILKTRSHSTSEFLWIAFFLGGLGTLAAWFVEVGLLAGFEFDTPTPFVNSAVKALVFVATPEETIKFGILVGFAAHHVDVRRMQDILALAVCVSLGFAAFENFLYVVTAEEWQSVAALRAITAVPGHTVFGMAMGAFITAARLVEERKSFYLILALAVPIFLHAAYDFPLFATEENEEPWLIWLWISALAVSVIFVLIITNKFLSKAVIADDEKQHDAVSRMRIGYCVVGGLLMLILGPVMGALSYHFEIVQSAIIGGALGLLPIALGADLMITARHYRSALQG